MSDDISNEDLVKAVWDLYPNGPSIGFKLLLQEALRRLTHAPAQVPEGWPETFSASAQTQVSNPAVTDSADEDGAAVVIASDDPVKDMPTTSAGRANIRMGLTRDGKGRP